MYIPRRLICASGCEKGESSELRAQRAVVVPAERTCGNRTWCRYMAGWDGSMVSRTALAKVKVQFLGSGYCLFVGGVLSLGQLWLRRNPRSGGQGSGDVGRDTCWLLLCGLSEAEVESGRRAKSKRATRQKAKGKKGDPGRAVGGREVVVLARASSLGSAPLPRGLPCGWRAVSNLAVRPHWELCATAFDQCPPRRSRSALQCLHHLLVPSFSK